MITTNKALLSLAVLTYVESQGKEPIKKRKPLGPGLGVSDVGQVGVAGQIEADVPSCHVLKECMEIIRPIRVRQR